MPPDDLKQSKAPDSSQEIPQGLSGEGSEKNHIAILYSKSRELEKKTKENLNKAESLSSEMTQHRGLLVFGFIVLICMVGTMVIMVADMLISSSDSTHAKYDEAHQRYP